MQLDFGGIAKGYAVDLAVARLRELGIGSAIVNAGGDLRAFGRHGDRPWRVAVRKPGGGTIGTLEVRQDEAMFTSGNYERFRQDEQERYPHILDPRSGWPVQGRGVSDGDHRQWRRGRRRCDGPDRGRAWTNGRPWPARWAWIRC